MKRTPTLLALAVAAGLGIVGVTGFSAASFVSASSSTSSVTAASDWTPPTVSVTSPGPTVRGTVAITATAADDRSGVASVQLQVRAAGATAWTTLCTATTAPYSCSWNTAGLADGAYDLQAIATDKAGNAATSTAVRTTVANSADIALADPGDVVRGTVSLQASISAGTGWTVRFERAPIGTTSWTSICSGVTAPLTCSWSTTGTPNGRFDLRAVATSGSTTITSPVVLDTLVDNLAPTVTLADPGAPLRGVVALISTSADAHSGVASVAYQAADSATGTFTTVATATTAPFSAAWDTTSLPYGPRHLRAVVTDRAGNVTTSTVIGPRLVDNTTRAITLADPGAFLEGTVKLTTAPTSTAPIASVVIQRAPAGSTTWTPICTVSAAPWSCAWATNGVADGSYDLRAVLTDANGNTATSNVVAGRKVDNVTTPLKALDVQSTNGGSPNKIDKGDQMVLTYSRQVDLTTITPGWDGSAIPIKLTIAKPFLGGDDLELTRDGLPLNLGTVRTNNSFAALLGFDVTLRATLTATTEIVNGAARTVVTVDVGDLVSGNVRTVSRDNTLTWIPSTQVFGLNGLRLPSTAAVESGISDRDF